MTQFSSAPSVVPPGQLPPGLSITNVFAPFFAVAGTCTEATIGALSATLSATSTDSVTATRAITITVNKASPAISGANNLSGTAGSVGPKTVTATITNGYFGGSTTSMPLTATISDGTNTATATATATGANASFVFPASELNALAVGGPYDITVSFAGNGNNDGFTGKIGTMTITAIPPTPVNTPKPPSPLPKTGDGFPLYPLLALLGGCLVALGWLGRRMRGGGYIR